MTAQKWFFDLMKAAGITPNGLEIFDPQILNPSFYSRVRRDGTLGLGESYMDNWWTCARPDEFIRRLLEKKVQERAGVSLPMILGVLKARFLNLQSVKRAFQVGERHYDLGNDLFQAMLGPSMSYSCGYWPNAQSLDEAQYAKFDLICRKLGLEAGMRVADIGCGWGSFAKYAAQAYDVSVVGITISREQADYSRKLCQGLDVKIKVQDYREFYEPVDRIVSVGMMEHVGAKNYRDYMRVAGKSLKPDGLFLLHTIGIQSSGLNTDPWTAKYIFPNGEMPSLHQISRSMEGLFVLEDLHNFGTDYDRTLMAWLENFTAAWPNLSDRYGEHFFRMWSYYLLMFAGVFRARHLQLWQMVLSPGGVRGGYKSIR